MPFSAHEASAEDLGHEPVDAGDRHRTGHGCVQRGVFDVAAGEAEVCGAVLAARVCAVAVRADGAAVTLNLDRELQDLLRENPNLF